jgi:hypothetical protein
MNDQVVPPEDYYGPNERVDAGQASEREWPGRDALLTIARQNARKARTQSAAAVAACSTTTHQTRKRTREESQVVLPEDHYGPNERVDAGQASNREWPGRDALLTIARQNARTARTQSAAAERGTEPGR